MEQSIKDYTAEALANYDAEDVEGLLKGRLQQGRERLEETREAVKALCELVEPPCDTPAYLRYFCAAESGNIKQLKENERKRVALYKLVAAFLRAYANLANEMLEAGYSDAETQEIKAEVDHYEKVRQEVKLSSGDYIDMKMYEPAMRHLLDTYIRATDSDQLSEFDDLTLIRLIVERGDEAVNALPEGIRRNPEAVAETIENNVRRLIIDEAAVNPKYYEKMSKLLDALIRHRKQEAIDYKEYLAKIVELTKTVTNSGTQSSYPTSIDSAPLRALYDNLEDEPVPDVRMPQPHYGMEPSSEVKEAKALAVDHAVRHKKKADWRGNKFKEREVRNAIRSALGGDEDYVSQIFAVVKASAITEVKRHCIHVQGTPVEVVRKDIKNLHLASTRRTDGCGWLRRCDLTMTRFGWP